MPMRLIVLLSIQARKPGPRELSKFKLHEVIELVISQYLNSCRPDASPCNEKDKRTCMVHLQRWLFSFSIAIS